MSHMEKRAMRMSNILNWPGAPPIGGSGNDMIKWLQAFIFSLQHVYKSLHSDEHTC